MVYRNLIGEKIGLIGSEKITEDLKAFLCELNFEQVVISEKITQAVLDEVKGCDYVLIGEDNPEKFTVKESGVVLLSLQDIYAMVDELETFYIDKQFGSREICVYGSGEKMSKMMAKNPNLNVRYVIPSDDIVNCEYDVIALEDIKKLANPFVIIAEDVSAELKTKFTEAGLEFGRDFHFFNPRIPKNPTSFYLRKTFMDPPQYTIPCDYTTKALSIKAHGNVMACCSSVGLALGNSLYTSIEEILRGIQAQLICLSINNRTFSFCGEMCYMFREKQYCLEDEEKIKNNARKNITLREIKDFNVQLGYDRSCNLACPSCRDHRILKPEDELWQVEMMHEEVKRMCSQKPKNMRIGNGELFFSPYYKDIIFNCYESESIALISNGMLFTPENWSHLEKRYRNISLEVSIDAINQETYQKLRGGDLTKLHKNMEFAGQLRKENRLKKLSISFVIQVENYKEMIGFVEYGRSIGADYIHFMKLNSWGHIPAETFIKMDVYDKRNEHHEEFVEILNNPIFRDEKVHVDNIGNFLKREK